MKLGMYELAIEIAEDYCRDKLEPVYIKYAQVLFKQKHFNKFETILLRAQRPDVAVELYQVKDITLKY